MEINGETFSAGFFEREVTNYRERLVRGTTSGTTESERYRETGIREIVLEQIINTTLIRQAADEDKLALTDTQLDRIIVDQGAFQIDGKFSPRSYNSFLSRQRITSADYKGYINNNYKYNSYETGIANSAFFVDSNLDFFANLKYQEFDYQYMLLNPANFIDDNEVDENILRGFYEENIEDYYLPAEFSIKYYQLSNDNFIDDVDVSERDIELAYFDRYGSELQQANVTLRQIFFADEEGINLGLEQQVEDIKDEIKGEQDFIRLATNRSQDVQTASNGGLLGELTVADLPQQFVEVISSSGKDEHLLGPIRTGLGVHLLWVVERPDIDVPELVEVRDELELEIRYSKVDELTLEKAENLSYEILNLNDMDRAAEDLGITGGKEQTFVIGDGFAEEFGLSFIEEVLLMNEGDNSDVIFLDNGDYLALSLYRKKEEELQPFTIIRDQVERDWRLYVAGQRTKALADEIVKSVESGETGYSQALELIDVNLRSQYSWQEVRGRSRSNADEVAEEQGKALFSFKRRSFPYGGTGTSTKGVEIFLIDGISEKAYEDLTAAEKLIIRGEYLESARSGLRQLVINSLRGKADIQVNEELAGVR